MACLTDASTAAFTQTQQHAFHVKMSRNEALNLIVLKEIVHLLSLCTRSKPVIVSDAHTVAVQHIMTSL